MTIHVTINGERRALEEGTTVSQMLESLGIVSERVVVEVNLTILKRAQLSGTRLNESDQVEIVHFVGGGCSDRLGFQTVRLGRQMFDFKSGA